MIPHQAGNAITSTDPAQKAGAVERVKFGISHSRSIPDVVQPGRRYQSTIGQPKSLSNMLRPVPYTLDILPPSRQLGQVPLGENPRISGRYHGVEPRRSNQQGNTRCQASGLVPGPMPGPDAWPHLIPVNHQPEADCPVSGLA